MKILTDNALFSFWICILVNWSVK